MVRLLFVGVLLALAMEPFLRFRGAGLWMQGFQRGDQLSEPGPARRHRRHAAELQRS